MDGLVTFIAAPFPLSAHPIAARPSVRRRPGVCMAGDQPAKGSKAPKSSASWANIWLPEFPRKGAGSVIGWDLRPHFLRPDPDAAACDLCSGTGKTTCSVCNGNEFMGPNGVVPCKACKVQLLSL